MKMKLFENTADVFNLPNGELIRYDDSDAVPFLYYNDKLYTGPYSSTHGDIVDEIFDENFDDNDDIDIIWNDIYNNGRIWTKHKIISFWNYPDKNKFIEIISDLEKELIIKIWDNNYKVEIEKVHYHTKDIEKNHPDYDKFEVPEIETKSSNGDITFTKFIPIEWYSGKNIIKKPKLTLQQRQLMYSEHIITNFKIFEGTLHP